MKHGNGFGSQGVWLMSYFNEKPPFKEEVAGSGYAVEDILLYIFMPPFTGALLSFFVLLFNGNFVSSFVAITSILYVIFWASWFSDYMSYVQKVREVERRYQEELKEYNRKKEEHAAREAESRRRSLEYEEENARKRAIEQEKERERAKELEAKAAIEREKQKRQQAFWGAHNWALGQLEHQYHALAIQLAAEHRVTDRDSVIKVFVEAWPHLPLASDERAGCLRYRAASDDRIAAIKHLLPPPSAENTWPD